MWIFGLQIRQKVLCVNIMRVSKSGERYWMICEKYIILLNQCLNYQSVLDLLLRSKVDDASYVWLSKIQGRLNLKWATVDYYLMASSLFISFMLVYFYL